MKAKLTLSIEASVIEMAKQYAKESGDSLSNILENHLKFITQKSVKSEDDELFSDIMALKGCIKLSDEDMKKSFKELRGERLDRKYGK
ncbi:MAG: hypothetical protein JKX84_11305 [Flavobacteriales bacterium]|nr:hypothetical protein [Flavobacteriales bacterium]